MAEESMVPESPLPSCLGSGGPEKRGSTRRSVLSGGGVIEEDWE